MDKAIQSVTTMWTNGSHPILWSYYVVQYLRVSAHNPFLSTSSTNHYHSIMSCVRRNVTVWKICFLETNHSAPFELIHLLIYTLPCQLGIPALAFMFPLSLEALHWLRPNTDLIDDWRDITVGLVCMPSLWKHNQLLVVNLSTHLQSLDSFGPFFLGVALLTNSSVVTGIGIYSKLSIKRNGA